MGYYIEQRNANFFIAKENFQEALLAIKSLKGRETCGDHFSWVYTQEFINAETLEEALNAWRWFVEMDKNGNIEMIFFEGEKLGDDFLLFQTIAPFVRENSWIEMGGEDGSLWRWEFKDSICYENYPTISWN